jgi:hypothetical protein
MRYAIAFIPVMLLGATTAFSASPKNSFDSARCPKPAQSPDKAVFKRLGELPPADAFRAVLRSDDNCRGRIVQARDKLGRVPKPNR